MTLQSDGAKPASYIVFENGIFQNVDAAVIEEGHACIYVNGKELVTLMCTPHRLDELTIGFLRSEGFIKKIADIQALTISSSNCVDVWLQDLSFEPPTRYITTSGCGGGMTFDDLKNHSLPVESNITIVPEQIGHLMKQVYQSADLYNAVRGVHTSALSDGNELVLIAQDIGRHNTLDRLWGQALQQGIGTEGLMLIASGRISSEMMGKAAKMQVPIIISRTSPTSLSTELAKAWNITTIGYARGNGFRIYSVPERVVGTESVVLAESPRSLKD